MSVLLAAAHEILTWLEARGWRACLIGGLAVQRWGEPRLTQDVDLTVLVDVGRERTFVDDVLASFSPRRDDARAFALTYRVMLVRAENGVALDVSMGATGFEVESIERSSEWSPDPGVSLRTCAAEELIVHKLIAARPRDIADVESVVTRQFGALDTARVRGWIADFAEVLDRAELGQPFERAVERERRRRAMRGGV